MTNGRVQLHVLAGAADLRRLAPTRLRRPEANLVLSVARLVDEEGLTDLVLACGLLAARGSDLRLEIVGEGPLREALEETAALTGAPVTLRGVLPRQKVQELYARAAVFCLPCVTASTGHRIGLPTSIIEAMALGVPIVTTAVNGLGTLVAHGCTGLVVPERDPCSLADALALLLADPELADRLADNARMLV
jgi:colanic acid/amylovoran biosynthesis glycosyltransferase